MNKTFEEFLQGEFMKQYNGDKDGYENAYEAWLEGLDTSEVIEYAEISLKNK